MTSFTTSMGRVYLGHAELPDDQIERLLAFFQERAKEAEKAAEEAREAHNRLWEVRCDAVDYRQDRYGKVS